MLPAGRCSCPACPVRSAAVGIHRQDHTDQVLDGVTQACVGQFIACPSPIGNPDNQAEPAQAGQGGGHALAGNAQGICKLRGEWGCISQGQKHARPGGVRDRVAEPGQHRSVGEGFHIVKVQPSLYSCNRVLNLSAKRQSGTLPPNPAAATPSYALPTWQRRSPPVRGPRLWCVGIIQSCARLSGYLLRWYAGWVPSRTDLELPAVM